jgi:steroid 5-alpha reductase family enzyme
MDEPVCLLRVATSGWVLIVALAALTWLASLVQRDVSLVDRMWSIYIAGAAVVYAAVLDAHGARSYWMLGLVLAWAGRLSVFITWRNWGHGEDRRYQVIRARNQPNFALKSVYLIFGLQSVLAWVVSSPFLAGLAGQAAFGWLDVVGIALTAFGIAFEAIGDAQMSRFRADPANQGRVMNTGVWRYSRHPNYFGETCVWWGLWLIALSAGGVGAAWSIVAPVLMTFLLLKVSGVSLLEKDITERRPEYREYVAHTNAFVPGPPRRSAP